MKLNKIDVGWIKLHRKFRKWKFYNKLKYEKVWMMMLMEANFKDQDIDGLLVKRGQLIFSYDSYSNKLIDSEPKITKQNIRTIVKNLEKHGQIKVVYLDDRRCSIVTIVEYEKYQKDESKIELLEAENKRLTAIIVNFNAEKTNMVTQRKLTWSEEETNMVEFENQHGSDAQNKQYNEDSDRRKANLTQSNSKTNMVNSETNIVTQGKLTCLEEVPLNKYLKKSFKHINNTKGLPKKYSKKFLNLAQEIITFMNFYLEKVPMKKYDAMDREEVLRPLHFRYKNGSKDVVEYKKIIDYMFNYWIGQVNAQGKPMMSFFTPQTLFRTHFKKYLRWAENNANLTHSGPSQDMYGESVEDKTTRIIKEAEEREEKERLRQQEEEAKRQKEESDKYLEELKRGFEEEKELKEQGKIIGFEF